MTAAELLRNARALLADEAHWTRGAAARDRDGNKVGATDARACCWCALGAFERVAQDSAEPRGDLVALDALDALEQAADAIVRNDMDNPFLQGGVVYINDCYPHGHADVLALYDDAVALCEKQERP